MAPPAICVLVSPLEPVAGAGFSMGGVGSLSVLELVGAAARTIAPSAAGELEGASELEELGELAGVKAGGSGASASVVAVDALEGASVRGSGLEAL